MTESLSEEDLRGLNEWAKAEIRRMLWHDHSVAMGRILFGEDGLKGLRSGPGSKLLEEAKERVRSNPSKPSVPQPLVQTEGYACNEALLAAASRRTAVLREWLDSLEAK